MGLCTDPHYMVEILVKDTWDNTSQTTYLTGIPPHVIILIFFENIMWFEQSKNELMIDMKEELYKIDVGDRGRKCKQNSG